MVGDFALEKCSDGNKPSFTETNRTLTNIMIIKNNLEFSLDQTHYDSNRGKDVIS